MSRWVGGALALVACARAPQREWWQGEPSGSRGGEVVLRCQPSDAQVWLDGVWQGRCDDYAGAPRGLKVGRHMRRVEIRKTGYQPYQTFIESDGTRAVVTVTLSALSSTNPSSNELGGTP